MVSPHVNASDLGERSGEERPTRETNERDNERHSDSENVCGHIVAACLHCCCMSWLFALNPNRFTSFLDMPVVANFHGSVGSSPGAVWAGHSSGGSHQGGVRPVDIFAINSLEIPPFAGCGNSAKHGTPNGCGRLLVDGRQVVTAEVRYQADEVQRRSDPHGAITVASRMRMLFEEAGVLWRVSFTNPSRTVASASDIEFEVRGGGEGGGREYWRHPSCVACMCGCGCLFVHVHMMFTSNVCTN